MLTMIDLQRIWAWAFDQTHDPEVKEYLFDHYVRDLRYHDPISADELSIYITYCEPKAVTFGKQLVIPIPNGNKKTRI